jgi:hypothetical protein
MAKDLHCLPSSRVFGRYAVVLVQVLSRDLANSNWIQLDRNDGCDVETRTVSAKVPNLGKLDMSDMSYFLKLTLW